MSLSLVEMSSDTEIIGKHDVGSFTAAGINIVNRELGIIQLTWPTIGAPEFEGRTCFPESYYRNSHKEKLLLAYCENFRQQFAAKYDQHKPLFLQALNECGIQKMVCTTIRPTMMAYPELMTWEGCASFVADFLVYEPLKNPILAPERIISPTNVLKRRKGNSFELASVLVSLLCGAGHKAYVVVGRASRDVTLSIQRRTVCPLQNVKYQQCQYQENENNEMKINPKYKLNPPIEFISQHLLNRQRLKLQAEMAEKEKEEMIELKRIQELEKPPFDDLHGWRLHAWVLLFDETITNPDSGINHFFIEPATGTTFKINHPEYLSIESVYNHNNYYINVQDRQTELNFDLDDVQCWEKLLCNKLMDVEIQEDQNDEEKLINKRLDMPGSWIEKLDISMNDIEQRYPNSQKSIQYKKGILEKYSPYSRDDGLVKKYTAYNDYDYNEPLDWIEWYENRSDYLTHVLFNYDDNTMKEMFKYGRKDYMKANMFEIDDDGSKISGSRTFEFYPKPRYDHLSKIIINNESICEFYVEREDRLISRRIQYDSEEIDRRCAVMVKEIYDRTYDLIGHEDVSEKHFSLAENTIRIIYHFDDNSIMKTEKCFTLPKIIEPGNYFTYDPNLLTENATSAPNKILNYELFCKCVDEMQLIKNHVEYIERNVAEYIRIRIEEKCNSTLTIPLFLTERNNTAIEGLAQKELRERKLKERELGEASLPVTAPFDARDGAVSSLQSKQNCLDSFKKTQLKRQNRLHNKYNNLIAQSLNKPFTDLGIHDTINSEDKIRMSDNGKYLKFQTESMEEHMRKKGERVKHQFKLLMQSISIRENAN